MSNHKTVMISHTELADMLHNAKCQSQSWAGCRESKEHRKVWMPHAKRVLSAADALAELHSIVCDAEIDQTFVAKGGCPERDRHIAWLRDKNFLRVGEVLPIGRAS